MAEIDAFTDLLSAPDASCDRQGSPNEPTRSGIDPGEQGDTA